MPLPGLCGLVSFFLSFFLWEWKGPWSLGQYYFIKETCILVYRVPDPLCTQAFYIMKCQDCKLEKLWEIVFYQMACPNYFKMTTKAALARDVATKAWWFEWLYLFSQPMDPVRFVSSYKCIYKNPVPREYLHVTYENGKKKKKASQNLLSQPDLVFNVRWPSI